MRSEFYISTRRHMNTDFVHEYMTKASEYMAMDKLIID